ncbi:MAG: type IV secretion system DNA-binding domain-containing protein [Candidatus Parcubacteria bacterium]|nr:type IV secretion system DNA-binding domain-containing protein [Candidatus Parcubacteria bacterium]
MSEELLKKAHDSGIAPFAVTTYRNKEKVFGIKKDDRRRHVYMVGKTGMGKTTLIENMVYSDIMAGHGVCYIDPHGDTAEKMLEWIPSWRINDVVYFNPADLEFPISFNVLEKVEPKYRHLVSSGLVGVFKKLWAESWGPRLEYILRNAILALLEYPDSTLLGINRLLVDKEYRKKVVEKIQDPVVRSFWVDEFPKWNERVLQEVVSPIQNKVGQFLSTALIRNVVGQVKSSVNLRDLMDNQKILILNLSKGRIGEDASALMGAMMVTKIQLAAMSRVDIPEEERHDFYLYVDEFQNFITDSFANILSEARKYRLNLTIAHQYIEQLGEVVGPAVFGNVGTIIVFRIGAADAEFLEQEFAPNILPEDLVNLPKYHIYIKLMIDGVTSEPFSARGLPPVYSKSMGNEEKVIRASRERYTRPREVVEDKIYRWSLGDKEIERRDAEAAQKAGIVVDVFAKKQEGGQAPQREGRSDSSRKDDRPSAPRAQYSGSQSQPPSRSASTAPARTDAKSMHPAKCDNCGADIEIPFIPDKSRPVFCKDCLKKSRRGEIKMQAPNADIVVTEFKEKTPTISLSQINKQTQDFKGRSVRDGQKGLGGKTGVRRNAPNSERPRIETPPVPAAKEDVKKEILKVERPRIEPPTIRTGGKEDIEKPNAQIKKEEPVIVTSAETKEKIPAPAPVEPKVSAEPKPVVKQEPPEPKTVLEPKPVKKTQASVDLLSDFGNSDSKEIKEGEEVEL